MPQYVAFLRGINLGRRRIKMDALRGHFEEMKFAQVSTFIASGNVLFETKKAVETAALETRIAQHLERSLGYEVDTFVRTRADVAAVAKFQSFPAAELEAVGNTVYVAFLSLPLTPEQARGLVACRTEVDAFSVSGREFYWLCRIRSSESKVWSSPQLKALKLPSVTIRALSSVRKLVAQFPPT